MTVLAATALSLAARELRSFLAQKTGISEGQIMIGHPKNAADHLDPTKQNVNLFMYRVDVSGGDPGLTSADPFYLRIFCLVTAFGADESNGNGLTISAGENDLRLIGEMMHHLHVSPSLRLTGENNQPVALLEMIFHPLSMDEINRIWSTQGDTPYRLSVAYEMALLPVPFRAPVDRSKKVSGVMVRTLPGMEEGLETLEPSASRWRPQICFVNQDGTCCYTQLYNINTVPSEFTLLVAGKTGETLSLVYEQWDMEKGWEEKGRIGDPFLCPLDRMDPVTALDSRSIRFTNPLHTIGQITLYAERTYQDPASGHPVKVRSNPLLLTLGEEGLY